MAIFVEKNIAGIHDIKSLQGFPITTEDGDACEENLRLQGLQPTGGYKDYQSIVNDAAKGKVHIFCMDENPANYFLNRAGILDKFYRATVIYQGQLHWGVRKGDDAMFNTVARGMAMITPAERKALEEQWIARPFILTPYLRIIGIGGGIALGLLTLLSLWLWLMRRSVKQKTQEFLDTHNKLLTAFNASPDAMWIKDRNGLYQEYNQRMFSITGLTPKAMIGHDDSHLFPAEVAKDIQAIDQMVMQHGKQHANLLTTFVQGEERKLDCIHVPLYDANSKIIGIFGIARDITELLRSEEQLRLAAVAFEVQVALAVLSLEGEVQRVNRAFTELTGYSTEDVTGQTLSLLQSQSHPPEFYAQIWDDARAHDHWSGEYWIATKQHQLHLVHSEISGVPDSQGNIAHYVLAMNDLTNEHEAHERAEHMALFDPVTDLPNRNALNEKLERLLVNSNTAKGALLLIDIDHFKRVNDLRGHTIGDRLLAQLSQRLGKLFGEPHILSRMNGGAFALLLLCKNDPSASCEADVQAATERLREALLEPFWLGNNASVTITVSIGWTHLKYGLDAPELVLKEAELAMYTAKADGRNCTRRFEPSAYDAMLKQEAIVNDLLNAISSDSDNLDLYLQLQVDHQGNALGAEALLRWTRPSGERIPPDVFIPIAEESGLILPLGDWVLHRACERLAEWAKHPLTRDLVLAINVSAKQFAQAGFVADVRNALHRHNADPTRLKLEITESMILGDISSVITRLTELRELGITISLDDFGTGYSSLTYLSRLPLDQLKIDKNFVSHLPENENDATVAQTIIGMGRGLGLHVIAEGVETAKQRDFLIAHGCQAFQGYFFARPLPLMEFEALLAEHDLAEFNSPT